MINVSNAWRSYQNAILQPETFVELTYAVTEPGLQEEAVISATRVAEIANVNQVISTVDKHGEKYATLDYGRWGLDGSYGFSDGSPVDPGYVSTVYSEETGEVTTYPTLTIDFAGRHDDVIPGMIITWDTTFGSWATDFRITAYNSGSVVAQTTVTGNTHIETNVLFDMVGYSQITIEIMKWSHPFQSIRCMEIFLGVKRVYGKSDLIGFEHSQSVDLLSAALPQSSVTFRLRNDDNRWNPDNPTGTEKYLLEQQEIKVRYGMDIDGTTEWIPGGTFWLSEWNTPSNGLETSFTARDAVGLMDGLYSGARSGTLYDIAIAALTEVDLSILDDGSERYIVSDVLKDIETDFTEDTTEYTIANVLQMVAHAGCCVFYQDRDGVVHIEPRSERYTNYMIEPIISYAHPEYTITKPLKAVSVAYGDKLRAVVDVANKGEVQTVDNPLIVTEADAIRVGEVARDILENRKTISGEFRSDLRVDALDNVVVASKYASNVVAITDIKYSTTGGTFRGSYTGRVVSITLEPVPVYVDEIYTGEIW